jgi:soluble lytic murein transglycosylase
LQRYKGTYQEDRLRNDWLLLLGQRATGARFAEPKHPHYRMNDDREVRCYALLMEHIAGTASTWPPKSNPSGTAKSDADDGCTHAAAEKACCTPKTSAG